MPSVLYTAFLGDERITVQDRPDDAAPGTLAPPRAFECPGGPMWICVSPTATMLFACTLHTNELVR